MKTGLVLEDDLVLAHSLRHLLTKMGLAVSVFSQLEPALDFIEKNEVELAIVDRGLPDGDGLDLVNFLHHESYQTKIIVLTTNNHHHQRLNGLKTGADDYLCKPFSFQEIKLKIAKLLHTHKVVSPQEISYENIRLNPESGALTVSDRPRQLRPKEAQILACLMIHQKMIISHQVLLDYVWQGKDALPSYKSLAVYIRRIRMQLGSAKHRLKTIRGRGYQLI